MKPSPHPMSSVKCRAKNMTVIFSFLLFVLICVEIINLRDCKKNRGKHILPSLSACKKISLWKLCLFFYYFVEILLFYWLISRVLWCALIAFSGVKMMEFFFRFSFLLLFSCLRGKIEWWENFWKTFLTGEDVTGDVMNVLNNWWIFVMRI